MSEDTEIDLTKPRPRKPQDRKPKADAPFSFTAGGKKHTLPRPTEDQAASIPFGITRAAVMSPDDEMAQMRLGFAMLDVVDAKPEALAALDSLPTSEAVEIFGEWMGESSGSSD